MSLAVMHKDCPLDDHWESDEQSLLYFFRACWPTTLGDEWRPNRRWSIPTSRTSTWCLPLASTNLLGACELQPLLVLLQRPCAQTHSSKDNCCSLSLSSALDWLLQSSHSYIHTAINVASSSKIFSSVAPHTKAFPSTWLSQAPIKCFDNSGSYV